MSAKAKLNNDLLSLIDRYYDDPVGFAMDCIGVSPTPQQVSLLGAVATNNRTAARSGHGVGKTAALAWLHWWFLSTRYDAQVPCTAPTAHQLNDILWKEVCKWHGKLTPIFAREFEIGSEKIVNRERPKTWFSVARTARREKPDALQGFHGDHLLYIAEEAGGIDDEIFQPILGALTAKDNRLAMVGNPTRLSGFFYDAFHVDRESYACLHLNAEESPLVTEESRQNWLIKYGADSDEYRIRVLGEFPKAEFDQLIPLDLIEAAVRREVNPSGVRVWGVDPARFGDDGSALAKRHGDVVESVEERRGKDTMQVAGWIASDFKDTPEKLRPSAIMVDVVGLGAGVYDRLKELGYPAVAVNVAETSSDKARFINLRAELWFTLRDWLKDRRGKLPNDPGLIAQLTSVKYQHTSAGKLQIEAKEKLKDRGLPSPDKADAVILTFAGPVAASDAGGWDFDTELAESY
jgi:phage terminase large subunit